MQKKLKKKVDLKFSKTQFKKTLPYVTRLNHSLITQRAKDRLEILKSENSKKAKKLKKLKSLKPKQGKINFDTFTKNTLKNYNKPKPKKKITDLIKFPEINLI